MQPNYREQGENLEIYEKKNSHKPPHIHSSLECIYITSGTLELGIGEEFYHMEKGDFAIVFPDLIHHYQVFSSDESRAIYLLTSIVNNGSFSHTLENFCPKDPVILRENLDASIVFAIKSLLDMGDEINKEVLYYSYVQIILSVVLPKYELVGKGVVHTEDIVYSVVAYLAKNFLEEVSLNSMARDLGYSPYAISRVFSGTFHTNFNKYLNNLRLDYAKELLEHTTQSITDVWNNAGFESQRTFQRVFKNRFRMTPREYRKNNFNTTYK